MTDSSTNHSVSPLVAGCLVALVLLAFLGVLLLGTIGGVASDQACLTASQVYGQRNGAAAEVPTLAETAQRIVDVDCDPYESAELFRFEMGALGVGVAVGFGLTLLRRAGRTARD